MISYIAPIVACIFLTILSILDIKTFDLKNGAIPSALTTVFIMVSFIFNPNYITLIISLLVGMLFVDVNLFSGVPDWKVIVACGIILPNLLMVLVFGLFITIFGSISKYLVKQSHKWKEMPFIPIIAISFLCTLMVIYL